MKKLVATLVLFGLAVSPAHAQIPVTDVLALVQLFNIVRNVREIIAIMKDEYEIITRMATGYRGDLGPFRVPAILPLDHNVDRYDFAKPLLDALNTGDPYGEKYAQVVRQVIRPGGLFDDLPPGARKVLQDAVAGIEIADSIATMGVHESASARGYARRIAQLIERLQRDVTGGGSEYHQVTTIADKLALAELVDTRLSQNGNQVVASILEQEIAKNLRAREAAAVQINRGLIRMADDGQSNEAVIGNATNALQNWRLR